MKGTSQHSEDFLKEIVKTTKIYGRYNIMTLFVSGTQILMGFGKQNDVKYRRIRALFFFYSVSIFNIKTVPVLISKKKKIFERFSPRQPERERQSKDPTA